MTGAQDWFMSAGGAAPGVPRIFCFPHAGGSPRAFLDWQDGVGADAEIVAVCRPGREHRAAEPAPSIGELVEGAAAAITEVTIADGRPFALFGHSLGALIAFEVCHRLAAGASVPGPAGAGTGGPEAAGAGGADVTPRHLIASGCSAPSLLPSQRVRDIARLTGQEFAEAIGFFGGLPPEVIADPELRDLLLPGVVADFRIAVGYRYRVRPPLALAATIVVGRDDPHVTPAAADPWRAEFTWPPDWHWVDGGHFYFDAGSEAITSILSALVRADQHVELI